MVIVSSNPPWKGRKKLERISGVLEIIAGVFLVIVGLIILSVLILYHPPAEMGLYFYPFVLLGLVVGLIMVWDGRRRLNEVKGY